MLEKMALSIKLANQKQLGKYNKFLSASRFELFDLEYTLKLGYCLSLLTIEMLEQVSNQ